MDFNERTEADFLASLLWIRRSTTETPAFGVDFISRVGLG